MSEVLIIARTRMKHGNVCVGAIDTRSGRYLRLLNSRGYAFLEAAPFRVGEVWEIGFATQPRVVPPHVEDVRVFSMRLARTRIDAGRWVHGNQYRLRLWCGAPRELYDGALTFPPRTSADAASRPHAPYVERGDPLPPCSLGLWVTDRLLVRREERRSGALRIRYDCPETGARDISMSLPHTGYGPAPLIIPAGSIVSLSLARWWAPEDTRHVPERCYVQLCDVIDMPAMSETGPVHAEMP